jgi:hypothetical protein
MNVIGRLKPGVSIREAQANVNAVVARMTHSLLSTAIRAGASPWSPLKPPRSPMIGNW